MYKSRFLWTWNGANNLGLMWEYRRTGRDGKAALKQQFVLDVDGGSGQIQPLNKKEACFVEAENVYVYDATKAHVYQRKVARKARVARQKLST